MRTSATVQQAAARPGGPHPLLAVTFWELRCLAARPASWIIGGVVFACFLSLLGLTRETLIVMYFLPEPAPVTVFSGSVWGTALLVPRLLLFVLGLGLPFVVADRVAHDLHGRTHELLMSTALPIRAYVLGRYLAGLLVSLALAGGMLLAIFTLAAGGYLAGRYPLPNAGAISAIWAITVVPALLLVSGLSFLGGTLVPRASHVLKPVVVLAWFLCWYSAVDLVDRPAVAMLLDPTGRSLARVLDAQYRQTLFAEVPVATETVPGATPSPAARPRTRPAPTQAGLVTQLRQRMPVVEEQPPDLWPWLAGRLVWAAGGLLCPLLAAHYFQRFRNRG